LGAVNVRKFKNDILDDLPVIKTDIDNEYEDTEYKKIANSAGYTELFKFANRFPNGKYAKSATEKANKMKYDSYKKDYRRIESELASIKSKIANKQIINPFTLNGYIEDFKYYSDYDPDRVKSKIASAQDFMKYAKYYAAYTDVQQTVLSILNDIENSQYPSSGTLRSKIDDFNKVNISDPDNVAHYIENASKLCVLMDGMTVPIPDSYREFSLGGAAVGVLGAIVSGGNLTGMAMAKPMNMKLFNEHNDAITRAVNVISKDFSPQIKQEGTVRFGGNVVLTEDAWKSIGKRLIERNRTITAIYNKDADEHNQLVATLDSWNMSSSGSSYSNNNSSSSNKDIDPDKVYIPDYEITTKWTNRASLSNRSGDQYLEAKFTDGTKIEIGRYKSDNIPFIKVAGVLLDRGKYETDDYAIKAAYVYEKYKKDRTIGRKK
jgi:hypothetical protein